MSSTTTETGATPQPVAVEKEDPWRCGWRYVRRQRPDGTEYREQVPLGPEDILFPQEEDFIVHTEGHNDDCRYLKTVLQERARGREGMLVLCDHRVDWEVTGLRPLGPDVAVFDGLREAWDRHRGTLPVRTWGARTLLVIEVTSPDSRVNDLGIKVEFYHRVGALFYAVVDRRESRRDAETRLFGYHVDPANPGRYSEVQPDERGRIWLETVRLWLGLENDRAVLYEERGDRIPDYAEVVQTAGEAEAHAQAEADARIAAEARAVAAEARAEELEAELQRLRGQGGPPNPAAP
ncbi:MAG TPA: Uma2 family endonuclease [Gemmataceae bacterium]|nr:Uma2 family endonuclease [Gemmataceae bacterium]